MSDGAAYGVGAPVSRSGWFRSGETRLTGPILFAYVTAGILLGSLGAVAGLYEYRAYLGNPPSAAAPVPTPVGPPVNFTLRAFTSGFVGVGGSLAGVRDPTLHARWNAKVTITVINGESMIHNFHLDGYGLQTRNLAGVNDSVSVTFVADDAGTFDYYCAIPGHREAGMLGELVVGTNGSGPVIGPEQPLNTSWIARDPTDLPPPIHRNYSTTVNVYLTAKEVTAEIEPGTSFQYWTYNGTVPGPFVRVRVNDTVVVHFTNDASSTMNHSVDFHAVMGPGGGAVATQTPPGQTKVFSFKAMLPGLFVYHCASPNVPTHIAEGMYGLILVEPPGGLPNVTHEFYLMQGELYTVWPVHTPGNQLFSGSNLLNETPTYVVFNGRYNAFTGSHALHVQVNDTVRVFFGVGGPNLLSSFHMIGMMFDDAWTLGTLLDPPSHGVQTIPVSPGSAVITQTMMIVPGNYTLLDHSITRAFDQGDLAVITVTGWLNTSIYDPNPDLGVASPLDPGTSASARPVDDG